MKKRIITAVVLAAVLLPLVILDHHKYPLVGHLFLAVGIIFSIIASFEIMSLFSKQHPSLGILRLLVPFMSGTLVYTIYLATTQGLSISDPAEASIVYHLLTMGLFILYVVIALGHAVFARNSSGNDMMASILTLTYCGLLLGFVINIRFLEPFSDQDFVYFRGGRSLGIYTRSFVTTPSPTSSVQNLLLKLCPEISLKKSVEGAIAGLIAEAFSESQPSFLKSQDRGDEEFCSPFGFLLCFNALSFAVQVGDLVASKLKRPMTKDFGNFSWARSVFDRFDSLIFSGAVYYIIVLFVKVIYFGVYDEDICLPGPRLNRHSSFEIIKEIRNID